MASPALDSEEAFLPYNVSSGATNYLGDNLYETDRYTHRFLSHA